MEVQELQKYIRTLTLKRTIKAPFMNLLRIFRYLIYQRSEDHNQIKKFKDIHVGERCFIVGNGPSLTISDLNLIENEHCFGFNRIFEVYDKTNWRPEFYMVLDNGVLKTIADQIEGIDAKYKFINIMGKLAGVKKKNNLFFFCNYGPYRRKEYDYVKKTISKDPSKYISLNYTVACAAIELAIYMGFKEIYLLGVDNNITKRIDSKGVAHIESGEDYGLTKPHDILYFSYYDAVESCYKCYKNYAEKNNIKIVNCTRGGKLEIFPRMSLEEVLRQPEEFLCEKEG